MSLLAIDQIRAILSVSHQPLTEKELSLYTGLSLSELKGGLEELNTHLESNDRVLFLNKTHSGWQLGLRKDFVDMAQCFLQEKPVKISRSCLEVLALIAYHQPITRSEIERVRGVSLSPNTLKQLFEWEWIEVKGHKDAPGRPEQIGTTKKFLHDFTLNSVSDLPQPELIEA